MVVNSDTHSPYDLVDEQTAMMRALGAGLTQVEADLAVQRIPQDIIRRISERDEGPKIRRQLP